MGNRMGVMGTVAGRAILKRLPLHFWGMPAAELVWRDDGGWMRGSGCSIDAGNYTLAYEASDGLPVALANTGYTLILRVPGAGDIDVTDVSNHSPINGRRLLRFLTYVESLDKWGASLECQLVVQDKMKVQKDRQNPLDPVVTPVKPWVGKPNPELLAADRTIKYCMRDGQYFGQVLEHLEGDPNPDRLYFTLGGVLQTEPQWRGFACIGLVGNVYGIKPRKTNNPFNNGEAMCAELAKEFGAEKFGGVWDPDALCAFLKSEGKKEWYMIWIKGHAGLIWNGVLYECKPSGHGFTYEHYSPDTESAVRRFTAADLESKSDKALNARNAPYYLARLRPPKWL